MKKQYLIRISYYSNGKQFNRTYYRSTTQERLQEQFNELIEYYKTLNITCLEATTEEITQTQKINLTYADR